MHATIFTALFMVVGLSQSRQVFCPALDPPPDGSTCGETGDLTAPSPSNTNSRIVVQYAACTTLEQCSEKCQSVSDLNCQSFSFDTATGSCTFYNSTISQQGFGSDPSSTATFYDASCFHCPGCAANLLNGNWEGGDASPWGLYDTSQDTLVSPGYKSKHAIQVVSQTTATTDRRRDAAVTYHNAFNQYARMCRNKNYVVTFWAKLLAPVEHNSSTRLQLNFNVVGPRGEIGPYYDVYADKPPVGKWVFRKSIPFYSNIYGAVQLDWIVGTAAGDPPSTFLIDDIKIVRN